ncbi:hypothetical protein NBRC116602_01360 [Hyphomicrobiales bacterium 4NK60-0047b]|jgi:hypothetical protein
MIKSTIALLTTLFTLFVFLSPATADTEFPEEKAAETYSALIVPVNETKAKKSKKQNQHTNSAQRIRDEKYLDLRCEDEEVNCQHPYKNGTFNPDYNTSNK